MKQTTETTSAREEDAPRPSGGGGPIDDLGSAELAALVGELEPALERVRSVGSGMRRWSADDEGVAGASFHLRRYRLGGTDCSTELEPMVRALSADPKATGSLEVRVEPLDVQDGSRVAAALRGWVPANPEEEQAAVELSRGVATSVPARAKMHTFAAVAESATTRNTGIVVVDPETCEAVWLYARAVRMTAHRR